MSSLVLQQGSHIRFAPNDSSLTYGSFGERKLSALCKGMEFSRDLSREALRVFRLMSASWSSRPLGSTPAWETDITDDGTPFEFSMAFGGGPPKLRILVEAQQKPMTLQSSWDCGLRLNERLSQLPNVDLTPFERVSDLFAPVAGVAARSALWHAAVLEADLSALYKVYLNPQVRGPRLSSDIVMEGLSRLNMAAAADFLLSRGVPYRGEQFLYFSLDLAKGAQARVKLYVAHPGLRTNEIDTALEGTRNYVPGEGEKWIRRLLGTSGPFERRPILTCLSFTASGGPPVATLHVPTRDYTCDDAYALDRACEFLGAQDGKRLRRALTDFAFRPLDVGRSLMTYVSVRREQHGLNVTTYMAPEAFAITPSSSATRLNATQSGK